MSDLEKFEGLPSNAAVGNTVHLFNLLRTYVFFLTMACNVWELKSAKMNRELQQQPKIQQIMFLGLNAKHKEKKNNLAWEISLY